MVRNVLDVWKKEEKTHFEGWDFSHIRKRMHQDKPPWDYTSIARRLAKSSSKALDIDTGGGEVLLRIEPPEGSYAAEGYKPNVAVARKNLKGAGVNVVYADAAHKLPFKDKTFDLVLNRHGAINAKEIFRVLKKDGYFLTQQVDSTTNLIDLMRVFGSEPKWTFNNLKFRKAEMKKLGFQVIRSKQWKGKITFKDVGAIVYFLKSIPWTVDEFSVKKYHHQLELLQSRLDSGKALTFMLGNFLILAKKR